MNEVDIQKFLEHLENIDKSLVTIARVLYAWALCKDIIDYQEEIKFLSGE